MEPVSPRPPVGRPRARRLGRSVAALSATALVLVATACGGPEAGSGDPDTAGPAPTELMILSPAQPTSYAADGGTTGGPDGLELMMNTHAGLIRNPYIDTPNGRKQDWYDFAPLLAESWDISPDQLTYTFHLHKGVISPAGNELTADDVLWSYGRKWAAPAGSSKFINAPYLTDPATQLKKVDEYSVSLTLAKPGYWFTMLSLLANTSGYVYDSDMLKEHVTPDDPYAIQWSRTNPNWAYGAYTVESLVPDSEMVLVANPGYVLGEPAIKRVTYRVVSDSASRANALRSQDADIVTQLRPADQADLREAESVVVPSGADARDTNLFLRADLLHNKPPFDDPAVRDAFAYAIPYQQIIDNVYLGNAARVSSLLAPSAPGFDGSGLQTYDYDPQRARQMLAAAGHPDGIRFQLTVSNALPDAREAAVQIQSFGKDAGFDIAISEQPPAAYQAGLIDGSFQAYLERDYSIVMAPSYELLVWTGPGGSPNNRAKWESQAFYDAVDAGIAVPDALSPEAGKAWNAAEKIMQEEKPWLLISYIQPFFALRDCVEGFEARSDNAINLAALSRSC